ncbi:MAG: energy transducer TonB [Mariniphaga sp.]
MTLTDSQRTGLMMTVLLHTAILLLLLFMGIVTPGLLPQEEGLLVDFGNSATGLGMEEPSAVQGEAAAVKKIAEPAIEPVSKPKAKKGEDAAVDEDILTQDMEKTVAIATAAKKKALDEKKIKLDNERRIKLLEEKRIKAELIEKQNQEAEERRVQAEKDKKIGDINSRVKNAFGGGKTDNGSQSTSQGNTYGDGNQGSPNGQPGVNRYGDGGGDGDGSRISYSLSGRNARSLPKPSFPGNESGTVVVEVIVDKNGKVTKASPGIKGSNTVDPDLLEAARKAALSATFNADSKAEAFQKGTITYHFIIQ